ncbi:TonB-dependent receptor [Marinifilum fragile]|uniref:TonB-dependent receptor n=1 Tax=Marinifilum fragile TaxID=570161 RepID=UPI000ABCC87A|nr:TonB-dependent receptor [Marinifilum fragile]
MSLNYADTKGFSRENDDDRIITNIRLNTQLNSRLKADMGASFTIRQRKENGIPLSEINNISQYQSILDENGNYIPQSHFYDQGTKDYAASLGYPYNWDYNIKQEFDNKDNSIDKKDVKLFAGLNYKILKGLDFDAKFQYEWGNTELEQVFNEQTFYTRNLVNYYTSLDKNGDLINSIPKGVILNKDNSNYKSFTFRSQINFNREFNDGLYKINAIAGIETRKHVTQGYGLKKYGYDPESLQYVSVNYAMKVPVGFAGAKTFISEGTTFTEVENRFASYYSNFAFTYADKYTFTGSARLDDSNLFGADDKYRSTPLWSSGINWQINKEDFFNLSFVDRLNLRVTYGLNGNVDKSTSPYLIAGVATDRYTQLQYAYIMNPENPSLRWEKTAVTNFGVDYALFNHRLNGSLEYYMKNSTDLLSNVNLNSTVGFSSALLNNGKLENQGLDISVNYAALINKFKWNVGMNFSYNKSKVKRVEMPNETVSGYIGGSLMEGKPLSYLYSYKWAGLSEEGTPQIYNENGDKIDHNTTLEDVKGLKYEGSRVPMYYGSLSNRFSYKNFSLSMLFVYKMKYVFRKPTISYDVLPNQPGIKHIHEDFEKRWMRSGDENITDIPKLPQYRNDGINYYNLYSANGSHNVLDGSHIRFKELIFAYELPKQYLKQLKLSALKLSFQMRNIAVLTFNKDHIDPENIPSMYRLPQEPEYTFGLKASF